MIGAIAGALLPHAFSALGGLFGGGGYKRPEGTIGTDQVIKMLKHGSDFEDIMAMGMPMSSRYMGHAQQKLMKHGLTPEQINALRGGGFGMGGGSPAQMGPMGFNPFMAMMPAMMNPATFSNPSAAGWLQSVFSQQMGQPQVGPGQYPGGGSSPLPFGSPNFGGFGRPPGKPGPAPSPFVGLRGLAGPFGNGGGAMLPFQMKR